MSAPPPYFGLPTRFGCLGPGFLDFRANQNSEMLSGQIIADPSCLDASGQSQPRIALFSLPLSAHLSALAWAPSSHEAIDRLSSTLETLHFGPTQLPGHLDFPIRPVVCVTYSAKRPARLYLARLDL